MYDADASANLDRLRLGVRLPTTVGRLAQMCNHMADDGLLGCTLRPNISDFITVLL